MIIAEKVLIFKDNLTTFSISGAEEESRTLDLNLGKVALYQLSYFRIRVTTGTHYRSSDRVVKATG